MNVCVVKFVGGSLADSADFDLVEVFNLQSARRVRRFMKNSTPFALVKISQS